MSRARTSHIVLHTLAYSGNAGVEEVRRWHLARGWSDIGYHWLVRRDGTLEKGRPEHEIGAHARDGGFNNKSVGIAFEGHGDYEPLTVQQLATLIHEYKRLKDKYEIPLQNVIGHRETGAPKTCPGTKVDMEAIRDLLWEAIA